MKELAERFSTKKAQFDEGKEEKKRSGISVSYILIILKEQSIFIRTWDQEMNSSWC